MWLPLLKDACIDAMPLETSKANDVLSALVGMQVISSEPASSVKAGAARTRLKRLRKQQICKTPGQAAEGATGDADHRRRAQQ